MILIINSQSFYSKARSKKSRIASKGCSLREVDRIGWYAAQVERPLKKYITSYTNMKSKNLQLLVMGLWRLSWRYLWKELLLLHLRISPVILRPPSRFPFQHFAGAATPSFAFLVSTAPTFSASAATATFLRTWQGLICGERTL